MGTRNKTIVKKNDKIIINQYGQWDGYPTGATKVIVDFLKNNSLDDINTMLEKTEHITKENNLIWSEITMGLDKEFEDIQKYLYEDYKRRDNVKDLVDKFGYEKTSIYLMLTRDTGYNILNVIKELYGLSNGKNIPIIIDEYDGWDIEGKNTIDLDKKTLTTYWHGVERTWDFDNLPSDKELEKFENIEDMSYIA